MKHVFENCLLSGTEKVSFCMPSSTPAILIVAHAGCKGDVGQTALLRCLCRLLSAHMPGRLIGRWRLTPAFEQQASHVIDACPMQQQQGLAECWGACAVPAEGVQCPTHQQWHGCAPLAQADAATAGLQLIVYNVSTQRLAVLNNSHQQGAAGPRVNLKHTSTGRPVS